MVADKLKRILIANDDNCFREKVGELLSAAGHEVRCVSDGSEAIEELKGERNGFDLLIVGLQMADVDGYAVLEWIRENTPVDSLAVLAVTGVYDLTHILNRLNKIGAIQLITTALSPGQVVHKVNRLLFPEQVMRIKPRVPISVPVDFTSGSETLSGNILNINESGLFLHTTEELKSNSDIHLTFTLPGSNMTISVNGIVKWCRSFSGEKRLFCGAGISFLHFPKQAQDLLRTFVHEERSRLGLSFQ